jgi:carboxypeptidase C (cathepsin A)
MHLRVLLLLVAALSSTATPAQVAPRMFVTHHKGVFGGTPMSYTAAAGETFITNAAGEPAASFFAVTYTKDGGTDPARRPVTFLFNGGPGSSTIWLHMGAFGPRRIDLPADATNAGLPPYPLTDNTESLLDVTDLVFIDTVGSGFSHALGAAKNEDYWNTIADADSVTSFIRMWLAANRRENSPKYLLGESYGSVRAALVIHNLQDSATGKITFNGLILLGQDLDTTETQQTAGNDMPYVIYLPTYAATAWYHGKIDRAGRTFEGFLQEAREFAITDYQAALFRGTSIAAADRARIAARVGSFTGLPQALIERENLRIGTAQYLRELLKDERKVIIRSDTRYVVDATEAVFDKGPVGDPPGVNEAFAAGGGDYLRRELGVGFERPYEIESAVSKWDYTLPENMNGQQTYHNVAPLVAAAMRGNPAMKLFMGSGYYDLMAAVVSMERTASHSGLPAPRITLKYYQAGHMIFLNKASLQQLSADVRHFITGSMP